MASWNKIQIGKYRARINKIEKARKSFPYCDEKGNILKMKIEGRGRKRYFDEQGNECFDVFNLVNGQPRRKLEKTKYIDYTEEDLVDLSEMRGMIIEQYYLVDCEPLRDELIQKGKVLKCIFTNGNGFKLYNSFICPYKNWLVMVLGWGNLDEEINNLLKDYMTQEQRNEAYESSVKRVNEEELLKAYIK